MKAVDGRSAALGTRDALQPALPQPPSPDLWLLWLWLPVAKAWRRRPCPWALGAATVASTLTSGFFDPPGTPINQLCLFKKKKKKKEAHKGRQRQALFRWDQPRSRWYGCWLIGTIQMSLQLNRGQDLKLATQSKSAGLQEYALANYPKCPSCSTLAGSWCAAQSLESNLRKTYRNLNQQANKIPIWITYVLFALAVPS